MINKMLFLLFLIISLSQAETNNILLKFESQEINISKDSETEDIVFYNIPKQTINNKNLSSCILEDNKRTEKISIYCTHKNLNTYYSTVDGFINPDNKFFTYTTFINLNLLSIDINKEKGGF